ncbi:Chemotaxis response regulator protein-glutamate methylesterase [Saliniradius amylolyticus]|uniref:Chemotaxis response regulator protein-glutamate methylesterase n=1 Tax=Saliniradius amylolyticus TaxID=2183582 RepID=A0A2S2DZM1_9ALTE|nr:response regulator transcription factor [Saliniradius amylolyticus]AWL10848.1 Chemotaxis response regulator protein-glutamate methylesterase [Saliniradius amylolyticus]
MRIVIADDHQLFREGLKLILSSEPKWSVVAEVASAEELLKTVKAEQPDLVMLDYRMPGGGALSALEYIKKRYSNIKVIMLTGVQSRALFRQMTSCHADGVLLKEMSAGDMLKAVHTVLTGKKVYSPAVTDELGSLPPDLTAREFQVLDLVLAGLNSQTIAERLNLASKTVENHRYSLMQKLNVKNTVELMRYANQHGLL